jgi:hypothetical protein
MPVYRLTTSDFAGNLNVVGPPLEVQAFWRPGKVVGLR